MQAEETFIERPNRKHEKKTNYDDRFERKPKRIKNIKERPKNWLEVLEDDEY